MAGVKALLTVALLLVLHPPALASEGESAFHVAAEFATVTAESGSAWGRQSDPGVLMLAGHVWALDDFLGIGVRGGPGYLSGLVLGSAEGVVSYTIDAATLVPSLFVLGGGHGLLDPESSSAAVYGGLGAGLALDVRRQRSWSWGLEGAWRVLVADAQHLPSFFTVSLRFQWFGGD
jgi:hypothetical protein